MLSQPDPSFGDRHTEPVRSYSLSQADADQADQVYSTPVDQLPPTASPQIITKDTRQAVNMLKKRNRTSITSYRSIPEGEVVEAGAMGAAAAYEDFQRDVGGILRGLTEFKAELMQLHAVLLQNSDGSEVPSTSSQPPKTEGGREEAGPKKDGTEVATVGPPGGSSASLGTPGGQVPTGPTPSSSAEQDPKRGQLLPGDRDITTVGGGKGEELQRQYNQLQDEFTQLEAECSTLRTMVEERNTFIKTMKSEIYRKEYKNDTERVDLRGQLMQRDALIKKLEVREGEEEGKERR